MNADSDPIERYLARLKRALGEASEPEREEILSDIRSLILERLETPGAEAEGVLAHLGTPEALAASYRMEGLLTRAAHGSGPLLVAQAALRWAFHGVRGFLTALTVMVGYAVALGFLATGVMKPILPAQTGLWIGQGGVAFGFMEPHPQTRELLGYWIIPVALLLALGVFVLTTRLARGFIRSHVRRAAKASR